MLLATSGSCSPTPCASPQSSIDFARLAGMGHQPTHQCMLRTAARSLSFVLQCVRVTNANGWATNHYRLSNVAVSNGCHRSCWAAVGRSARRQSGTGALPGQQLTGATHACDVVLPAARKWLVDRPEFSGWRINATTTTADYDSNCAVMNLTRDWHHGLRLQRLQPTSWSDGHAASGHPSAISGSRHRWQRTVEPDRDGVAAALPVGMRGNAFDCRCRPDQALRTHPQPLKLHRQQGLRPRPQRQHAHAARRHHRSARHARRNQQRSPAVLGRWALLNGCRREWRRTWRGSADSVGPSLAAW